MKKSTSIGLALLAFTLLCRYSTRIADLYALYVYPPLSGALSWLSSGVSFSMQDVVLVLIVAAAIGIPVVSIRRKRGFVGCLKQEALLVLWTYVWFYMAWCNNYGRSSIYARTGSVPVAFDEAAFTRYLEDFTERINTAWTPEDAPSKEWLEEEIKAFYNRMPTHYGLARARAWQHPKTTVFNAVYSAVGIQGFMEPLLAESCINRDMLPGDYPFVYAHEYAHLLGISNEAECNWWAYQACISSGHEAVRYSTLKNILPHLMRNARMFYSEEKYQAWMMTLRPEVMEDLQKTSDHWRALRSPQLRQLHEVTYDLFLRGNNISSGLQNYSEVVGLLLSIQPH